MKNLRSLNSAERESLEAAVAVAEAGTAAQIVPVILSRASRDEGAEARFGFLVALATLALVWWRFQGVAVDPAAWVDVQQLRLGLLPVILVLWLGFLGGCLLARLVPRLALPLRTRGVLRRSVEDRARDLFHRLRSRHETAPQLVLLLVARFEGEVVLLADPVSSAVLEQGALDEIVAELAAADRAGRLGSGLVAAVTTLGSLLAEGLPAVAGAPVTELPALMLPDED